MIKKDYMDVIESRWYDMDTHERLICCGCGLTHEIDFRLHNGKTQFKFRINKTYTNKIRKKEHFECVKKDLKK